MWGLAWSSGYPFSCWCGLAPCPHRPVFNAPNNIHERTGRSWPPACIPRTPSTGPTAPFMIYLLPLHIYLPYISCFLELLPPIYVRHRRFTSVLARDWGLTCATLLAEHLAICALYVRPDTQNKYMNYDSTTPSPRVYIPCR